MSGQLVTRLRTLVRLSLVGLSLLGLGLALAAVALARALLGLDVPVGLLPLAAGAIALGVAAA
ncbi:MAG: hypothetical protein M0T75_11965 [Chloroflexi bacterium]|nr:hypothetical protein [Chloroflexota bacterium]